MASGIFELVLLEFLFLFLIKKLYDIMFIF